MAIRSRKNQYIGINAHLHSRLQNEPAGWEIFHGTHITHLAEAIDALLPPGYLLDPEKSMQIREYHPATGEPIVVKKARRPRPDITILDVAASKTASLSPLSSASTPTLLLPAAELIGVDEEIYLTAIAIRELSEEPDQLGKPVAWLELLSPTNKPSGMGFLQYVEKRTAALRGGIVLVELDYLHQTPSTIEKLPSYPDAEKGATPYSIVVTDPRPSIEQGEAKIYGFVVDEVIPKITIPLAGEDQIIVDLGSIYKHSFESISSYSYRVDYEREPERFDAYTAVDQIRIKRRMKTVQHYHQQGIDLEQSPFPLLKD